MEEPTKKKQLIAFIKKYRWQVLSVGIIVFFILLTIFLLSLKKNSPSETTPPVTVTPIPNPSHSQSTTLKTVSPLQKSIPGQPVPLNLEQMNGFLKKTALSNEKIDYSFQSPITKRPNEVITTQDIVLFERILIPVDPQEVGHAQIASYVKKYGFPEKIVQNSVGVSTYIYANKGIAFVGNPNTDEIFEVLLFVPMSVSDFIINYGEAGDYYGKDHQETY